MSTAIAVNLDDHLSAAIDAAAGETTEVIAAPGAGKKIVVWGFIITHNTTGTSTLKSATTAKTGAFADGIVAPCNIRPWFTCGINEALNITTATCTADGIVAYSIEG